MLRARDPDPTSNPSQRDPINNANAHLHSNVITEEHDVESSSSSSSSNTKRCSSSQTHVNSEQKQRDIQKFQNEIYYSPRYSDDVWEYRHVVLPKQLAKYVPADRLMPEDEWRGLGVRQSLGWEHYMIHAPEPHILLFRREKDYQAKYPNGKP